MDAKLKKLLMRFEDRGYAVYWHCLELIMNDVGSHNLTFRLEHDSEIIADNLRIKGSPSKSGREIVEEIMRYMIELGLFSEINGSVYCFPLLSRLDHSMTGNTAFRIQITEKKKEIDKALVEYNSPNGDTEHAVMTLSGLSHVRREEKRTEREREREREQKREEGVGSFPASQKEEEHQGKEEHPREGGYSYLVTEFGKLTADAAIEKARRWLNDNGHPESDELVTAEKLLRNDRERGKMKPPKSDSVGDVQVFVPGSINKLPDE